MPAINENSNYPVKFYWTSEEARVAAQESGQSYGFAELSVRGNSLSRWAVGEPHVLENVGVNHRNIFTPAKD